MKRGRRDPGTPPRSVVRMGEIADQLPVLEIACNRCDRRGRLYTARLVVEHGAQMPLPDLLRLLSADCHRRVAGLAHDPCGAHLPGLARVQL